MAAKSSKGGNWVTINGVHVLIENGKITKGPAKFIGSTLNDLPSSGKSAADRKAELKAKYANKTGGSAPKESVKGSPKTTTTKATTKTTSKSTKETLPDIGKDTDFSKLTKTEINKGIKQLEKQYGDDPYVNSAIDEILFNAENALASGNFKKSSRSGATKKTIDGAYNNSDKMSLNEANPVKSPIGKNSAKKELTGDETMADYYKRAGEHPTIKGRTRGKTKTSEASDSASTGRFTMDGETYELRQIDGAGHIVKVGGAGEYGDTLVGFNSKYKTVKDAKNVIQEDKAREIRRQNTEKIAKETGGVALYTGKVIDPTSVKKAGVSSDGYIQYTAVDAQTGKTIKLDSADMGAVMVAGIDAYNTKMTNATFRGATTKATATSGNPNKSSSSRSSGTKTSSSTKTSTRTKSATKTAQSNFSNAVSEATSSTSPKRKGGSSPYGFGFDKYGRPKKMTR